MVFKATNEIAKYLLVVDLIKTEIRLLCYY